MVKAMGALAMISQVLPPDVGSGLKASWGASVAGAINTLAAGLETRAKPLENQRNRRGESDGSFESWRFGRFALEQTENGYGVINAWYMIGGMHYAFPTDADGSIAMPEGSGILALVVDATDTNHAATLEIFDSMDKIARNAGDEWNDNVPPYIFPLYTIETTTDEDGSTSTEILVDWRFGPTLIMAEF